MDVSQYGEATFIHDYFQKSAPKYRFLVDVGALGIDLSNTFDLLKQGWAGLLIEAFPQEQYLRPMMESLKDNLKVKLITDIAIGDYEGMATGFLNKIRGHRSLIHEEENFGTCQVRVRPLALVLQENEVPFDFDLLSVDAEGFDRRILECFLGQSSFRPRVIVYEKDAGGPFIERWGYHLIHETKGNLIYGSE